MRKTSLTLTLAGVLATLPALAADWAHNDPDKASTGKVQIWDGSKSVTVDSAPATAVATLGGGAALGDMVQSQLSFTQYIAANDLDPANWKDVTFKPGVYSVSIAGTELAKKTGKTSVRTMYSKIIHNGNLGTYYKPQNSSISISKGYSSSTTPRTCKDRGRNGHYCTGGGTKCTEYGIQSNGSDSVTVSATRSWSGGCSSRTARLTVVSPALEGVNFFMRVGE